MAHRIEYAPTGRSKCRTCGDVIERGALRLAEEFLSEYSKNSVYRFHHLACGAEARPYVLRPALKNAEVEIPERAELERAIGSALTVADAAADDEGTAAEYARFVELMNKNPEDETAPLVFADWLQSVDDPRGQLISLQAALESEPAGPRREQLRELERELLRVNRRTFVPEGYDGKLTWRAGFVHRVALSEASNIVSDNLARLWRHPSLMLVRELIVDRGRSWTSFLPAPNLGNLPDSLTLLDVDVGDNPIGALSAIIATAPRLLSLRVTGVTDLENLEHPRLVELEITLSNATEALSSGGRAGPLTLVERLAAMAKGALPQLERLSVRCREGADDVAEVLARGSLLEQLTDLELGADLGARGVKALATALEARAEPLATLDVSSNTGFSNRERVSLEPLVETLELPRLELVRRPVHTGMPTPIEGAEEPIGDWKVVHTRKPEWGVGIVVEELDDKLVIEFENAGRKTIRGTELLEDV